MRKVALWFFPALVLSAQPYRVDIQNAVPVKMQDGVTLVADVYRPETEGRFPVLLQRTPYNRAGAARDGQRNGRAAATWW